MRVALTTWLARPLTSFHLVLAVFGLLTVLGLVMVYSASSIESLANGGTTYRVFQKQVIYCGVGLVLFWVALRVPPRVLRRLSPPALLAGVVLLILVLTPLGTDMGTDTRSWFRIGGVLSFQPVEFAKVALVLWGAHILVIKRAMLHQYRHLLVPLMPVALLMFTLVMMQPDLGGTIALGVIPLALLWFAGAPLRLFAGITLSAVSGALVLATTANYRLDRITGFLNPDDDPQGANFQARQALYALGEGGFFGKGLGRASAKWDYLPNVHNDFIFAIIGEELGFVGCVVVLGLFATLAYVGLRIAARNTDPWIRLVAATVTVWLVSQAAFNIGYVVGLLPVTGLTLPLISSGGTSVVTTMLVFGMLANFARHEPEAVSALRAQGQDRFSRWLRLPMPDPYRPPARRVRAPRSAAPAGRPPLRAGRPTGAVGRMVVHPLDERRRGRRGAPPEQRRRGAAQGGQR
ncbi:cell division-specific peptidoglycan biosynthesis regulator FtsW [Streptoalloteichus hindustanus]|uniref:Probable peptidoglycan glycosyltransferase FtsW n=1 Tax=Streptoalloteichus hindustanus TaxID=2017 RepID=A0A1M5AU91_STRHI|nr:cell division-specific peptidoglycan biosynthesis regulator FtsW [Streptoalloteichus hindustanus]